MDKKKKTSGGFRIFEDVEAIKIIESARAFQGPYVWLSNYEDCITTAKVRLSLKQAKIVVRGLTQFIEEAEAGNLVEKC
jgi:hypothetical protein